MRKIACILKQERMWYKIGNWTSTGVRHCVA